MLMRGGSSKGAYFVEDDLPSNVDDRNDVLRRVMGSPDKRQIDGIGGAHPLTSKVAIVGPTDRSDADLTYLFLQVGVDDTVVTDRQNCGNLLAGVGPFALERGLINADRGANEVSIRILMCNTNTVVKARLSIRDGMPLYEGSTTVSGVPGSASAIHLDFEDLAGSTCGSLLPTGNAIDTINKIECTLIDNGMPVVVIRASDVGVLGSESCTELEADVELRESIEAIRLKAGHLMNLGDVANTTIPKVTLVSTPDEGGNIATRTFIPHRCHDAIGVLGAVSVATAALLPGSTAETVTLDPAGATVRLEHPTGFLDAGIELAANQSGHMDVRRAGIVRTARKLMDGTVFARATTEER